jgi:hypothetical protein
VRRILDLRALLWPAFEQFQWTVVGIRLEDGSEIPVPRNSTCVSAIIEQQAVSIVAKISEREGFLLKLPNNTREYPDATLSGGPLGDRIVALDVKTSRLINQNRISGFTIGSYAGYFLHPQEKRPGCSRPYGDFSEHWIVGFVYEWFPRKETKEMVNIVQVIIAPKWRIASRSTGTGTTKHISSVRQLRQLREMEGAFQTKAEFEDYWRTYGKA